MDHKRMMRWAIAKAYEGMHQGQAPFGACLVHHGQLVACDYNRVQQTCDPTAHAEIVVLRTASSRLRTDDLSESVLFTTCEPCPMCFSACHWAQVKMIVYASLISDAQQYGLPQLPIPTSLMKHLGESPIQIMGEVLREEAVQLFHVWTHIHKGPYSFPQLL